MTVKNCLYFHYNFVAKIRTIHSMGLYFDVYSRVADQVCMRARVRQRAEIKTTAGKREEIRDTPRREIYAHAASARNG